MPRYNAPEVLDYSAAKYLFFATGALFRIVIYRAASSDS